jgi:hypothetical protein
MINRNKLDAKISEFLDNGEIEKAVLCMIYQTKDSNFDVVTILACKHALKLKEQNENIPVPCKFYVGEAIEEAEKEAGHNITEKQWRFLSTALTKALERIEQQ